MNEFGELRKTADEIEDYADRHMFDEFGLMISAIDSHTYRPFEKDFITEEKVPRRAVFSPWSFWSYEDSIMTTGHYIDGLVMKYEYTGDNSCIEKAKSAWEVCLAVSYQSQAYGGLGCFLRPYGGLDEMEKFGEPLGTDQAAPLFYGAYRLRKYLSEEKREELDRTLINMLTWYADQGYAYRYYKSQQHYWQTPNHHHASSFYLPAIAFAAKITGEKKWKNDLDYHLNRLFKDPEKLEEQKKKGIAWNFKQGGLLILKELMGESFQEYFTSDLLDRFFSEVKGWLSIHNEPGMLHRQYPESSQEHFKARKKNDNFSHYNGLGFPHTNWAHSGRMRPRHEATILTALACFGNKNAEELALQVFNLRKKVPEDFTHYLSEEYPALPDAVHLYARSIGALMLDWWRNFWVLNSTCNQSK